jgi:hypothetical protein
MERRVLVSEQVPVAAPDDVARRHFHLALHASS